LRVICESAFEEESPVESIKRLMRFVGPVVLAFIPVGAVLMVTICPADVRGRWGIFAGLVSAACAAIQACYWLLSSKDEPIEESLARPQRYPMYPTTRLSYARDLDSLDDNRRREAIQAFADSGTTPIAGIQCWPEQQCTNLQLAAAEAILREWLEFLSSNPDAPEESIIAELFPLEEMEPERDVVKPRVRRLAPTKESPPSRIVKKLDQLSETIKDKMLDWEVVPQENVHAESEGEDVLLAPLDRRQFAEHMRAKVDETMGFVTDSLAAARTDYDLLLAERTIHPLLSTLRWEAVATALELRQPDGGPVSVDEVREIAESLGPAENAPPNAKPTGDWVSKYRRMRAAGI
jgi:hypothetical protein